MSDGVAHDPRAASLALLDGLTRRGRELVERDTAALQGPPYDSRRADLSGPRSADVRIWQMDCAAAINELSGGNKAHWLSRAYSGALLVRSADGEAVVEADPGEIVRRVLDVLEQGRQALISMDTAEPYSPEAQEPHRFDFVHDAELRPVLERAFIESRSALENGNYEAALKTTCGILEAILTDALDARLKPSRDDANGDRVKPSRDDANGDRIKPSRDEESGDRRATASAEPSERRISDTSFAERIAAAEAAGLIRGGCARLPAPARAYRDADQPAPISEREATVTRQVLRVVMRDLDPGR